METAYKNNSTH